MPREESATCPSRDSLQPVSERTEVGVGLPMSLKRGKEEEEEEFLITAGPIQAGLNA